MLGEEEASVHIYRIPVSWMQYRAVAHRIWRMQADEEEYIYNAFAPLLAPFGREVNAYKAEICSQFVAPVPANGRRAAQGAVRQKRGAAQRFC